MSADKSGPDAWRLRYAELDGVPLEDWPEAARAYPIRDARYTYDVAVRQIADGRNLHDLPNQVRAHWALHLMSMWGVRTDRPWVEEFSAKVTAEHNRTRAKHLAAGLLKVRRCVKKKDKDTGVSTLEQADTIDPEALDEAVRLAYDAAQEGPGVQARYEALFKARKDVAAGRPMKYGTDKKALEALVTAAYQGEPPRSAKGNIKTNKDTLKESGDDLLADFAADQESEKFFSTYLKVLKQGTVVPIGCKYNVLVATGRTSCSKPNMQNMPRGGKAGNPREAFVARPGTMWSSNDFPSLELRTLAFALEYLGFQSEMAKALRADVDLHEQLGAQLVGVSLAEFRTWKKGTTEQQAKYKAFRQMAKAGNFGLPGGLGATKLVAYARDSYGARLCILSGVATVCGAEKFLDKRSKTVVCKACHTVAVALKKLWFETWPEMNEYFDRVKEWTGTHTAVIEVEGEDGEKELEEVDVGAVTQIVSERVRGCCTFTNGANSIFQGLGADVAKRALWLVTREAYTDPKSVLWGSRPVVFVHDEIITEHPEGTAHEGAFRVAELMNEAFKSHCPTLPCDVRPALMRRWHKGAEETYLDGKLTPWEPLADSKRIG